MKVSDYVAEFLAKHEINTVFGYQGSSISHVIDSISRSPKLEYIQTCHEQAAVFAANGYAIAKNGCGAVVSCSGPGATNLITGIANAYYDSNRCICITGQVSTSGIRKNQKIRQLGFQETDIVSIVTPITKYAVTVFEPEDISYYLEKAYYLMCEERPGPVLIDIPHNVQNRVVDKKKMRHYTHSKKEHKMAISDIKQGIEIFMSGKRPLILLGGGARELKNSYEVQEFLKSMQIPIVASYRGKDIYDNTCENYIGVIGSYGNRYANLAVNFCDTLLVLGSRVDGRQTGDNIEEFAKNAKVIYIDIDENEIAERPSRFFKIHCDAKKFMEELEKSLQEYSVTPEWLETLYNWKNKYLHYKEYGEDKFVNPNELIFTLTESLRIPFYLTVDVGQNQIWVNASSVINKDSMLIQSAGLGSMGFSLPAAIGAYYGGGKKNVICVCGDGGFQMNLQELQTISENNIPIKIFIFNNKSLGLIRVYQDKALSGNYEGSVIGFGSPDYSKLAKAYGITYYKLQSNNEQNFLKEVMATTASCIIEVLISESSTCYPEPTYQLPVYKQSPMLSREENQQMESEIYGK